MWFKYPYIFISLKGDWDTAKVEMFDIFGKQIKFSDGLEIMFYEEGMKSGKPIMKYGLINHPRIVRILFEGNGCQGVVTKIIYI